MQISNDGGKVLKKLNEHKNFPILDHPDQSVTTPKLADQAVTQGKIADSAVDAGKIADSAVTTGKIADLNVTQGKIADQAIGTGKIADLAVTSGKIADLAVTNAKIADLSVTQGKLADGSVTTAKIATGALDTRYYTKTQIDSATRDHLGTWRGHVPDEYFTKLELQGGALNSQYISPAGVDTKLNTFTTTNLYTKTELNAGQLDSRYYTEAEVDAKLAANVSGNHTGTWQGYTPAQLQGSGGSSMYRSVKSYGAVGDGTADDTSAIASAIAALQDGDTLYFPATVNGYVTTSPLTIPRFANVIMDATIWYKGTANDTCLTIGDAAGDVNARTLKLSVRRNTTSNWLSESSIGIKLVNLNQCDVQIVHATDFTIGVQLIGDGRGFAYNNIRLQRINNNKIGLDLTSTTGGWCNENLFLGGRFAVDSNVNLTLSRYGVRMNSAGLEYCNNNVFQKPSFELSFGSTMVEALCAWIVKGENNHFLELRAENNGADYWDGILARTENDSTNNKFVVGTAGGYGFNYLRVNDTGAFRTSYVEDSNYLMAEQVKHLVYKTGPLHKTAKVTDGNLSFPDVHISYYSETTVYKYSATSGNATLGANYVELNNGWGVGVFVDLRNKLTGMPKRFVIRRDAEINYGGRLNIVCYDASGAVMTGGTDVKGNSDGSTLFWTPGQYGGGSYDQGSDSSDDFFVWVSNNVSAIRVVLTDGSNPIRLRGFSIFELNPNASTTAYTGLDIPSSDVKGVFYVDDFAYLATGIGTANEDWQPAIQACIDLAATFRAATSTINDVVTVKFGLKRYKTRKPIMLPRMGITLEGVNVSGQMPDIEYTYGFGATDTNCTIIEKTTTTTWGTKTRTMRGASVTDNYNVDAIIMVDHPDEQWTYNVTIKNLFLRSRTATGYGIFAPRLARSKFENVMIYKAPIGFFTYDTWMTEFNHVHIRDATTAGFRWITDTGTNATGTSTHFNNCFADTCGIGFDLQRLHYSVLNACAADHITGICYKLSGTDGITMNGCGAEDTKPNCDIFDLGNNALVTVNGFSTYDLDGATAGTHAVINITGNGVNAVFNACKFVNYNAGVNTTFTKNYIIAQSCNIEFHSCVLPTNGGAATIGTSSVVHTWDLTGYKQITSAGTKTAQMV